MLRYCNIEYVNQLAYQEVETRTGGSDMTIGLVGLSLGPIENGPVQCIRKNALTDIRAIAIHYTYKNGTKHTKKPTENGFKTYMRIIKHFFIDTIALKLNRILSWFMIIVKYAN